MKTKSEQEFEEAIIEKEKHISKSEKSLNFGKLHSSPFVGFGNRKKTLSRIQAANRIQSIPCWEKGREGKFLGFKYIEHKY